MNRLKSGDLAPRFALPDHTGTPVPLEDLHEAGAALLVFNIGFV